MTTIAMKEKVLSENQRLAAELRERFAEGGTLALNLISSPGSGKTSVLERTLEALPRDLRVAVLTGDIQTDNDARRLGAAGFPAKQITTGGACHLDARMIARALESWPRAGHSWAGELPLNNYQAPVHEAKGAVWFESGGFSEPECAAPLEMLFIENVGNLVCPSSYDLGEQAKVVLLSVTEGEDKPLKYPSIFSKAELCIVNKIDLLPYVSFDLALARENIRKMRPDGDVIEMSCKTGAGISEWLGWIEQRRTRAAAAGWQLPVG